MSRNALFAAAAVVAAVLMVPNLAHAQSSVQVTGVVGGSQLFVTAKVQGGSITGAGKLTAPTGQFYYLKVQSGEILQGHYVRMQGSLLTSTGVVVSSFSLIGDSNTGGIVFSYTGRTGTVTQKATGSVVIQ